MIIDVQINEGGPTFSCLFNKVEKETIQKLLNTMQKSDSGVYSDKELETLSQLRRTLNRIQ